MTSLGQQPDTAAHIGSYALDDLLVNCCKEIISHGMDTEYLPATIKDWIAGKIFKSLPKRLVQKFLAFLLDDRDLTQHVGFRENQAGDEFTLLLYKSDAQKKRKEDQWEREIRKFGEATVNSVAQLRTYTSVADWSTNRTGSLRKNAPPIVRNGGTNYW